MHACVRACVRACTPTRVQVFMEVRGIRSPGTMSLECSRATVAGVDSQLFLLLWGPLKCKPGTQVRLGDCKWPTDAQTSTRRIHTESGFVLNKQVLV